ncbi:MAG: ABC transporter permease [Gemmataceae bacterium]|nr:ABC transporter permease [Gemmataceae bacterium]
MTAATVAAPDRPHSREVDLLLAIYLAVIVVGILYPLTFFSGNNARAVLNNLVFDGILAVGMMLLMVAGVFDLSVGAMASMTGVLCGWLMVGGGWPVAAAVPAALAVAALGGFVNGVLVARARVNALITTLGTLGIFQGVTLLVGGPGVNNLPKAFAALGQKELLGLQLPVWGMLGLALAAHYLLRHTPKFRQFYYVGSNPRAARLSGIDVPGLQVLGFTLMGVIAGAAGLAFAARVGSAVSTAGDGAELRVITAVILGGASLTGGKGSIPGALLGVLFMALVTNVLFVSRVSSVWQGVVVGVILVAAVALDAVQNRRHGG